MRIRAVLDVHDLPEHAFGSRAPIWWGTIGLCLIEGTMFGLAMATYLYLRLDSRAWPPLRTPDPDLLLPTINLVVMLVSVAPMVWADLLARRGGSKGAVRFALILATVLGLAALVLRWFEFDAFHVRWDTNAYGSIVWLILGLHTAEILASVLEDVVFVAYTFRYPLDEKHRVDVSTSAVFWYFVVGIWVPLYLMLYFTPRLV
ncbi:MAG TPA: cytochrome c oxidase subunit 3 [Gemmatimonadaceae bacterium]|nr:cytochrome c oxidase subunit 3 [Gemmatimonadaceae bacterium]